MKENLLSLVIDDDCDLHSFFKFFFQKKGINSYHSTTLKEGKLEAKIQPNFIFLDNQLPDGSGFEVIPQLKTIAPQAFIIAMTALVTLQNKKNAIDMGADYFLEKPFSLAQFQNLLNQVLQSYIAKPKNVINTTFYNIRKRSEIQKQ